MELTSHIHASTGLLGVVREIAPAAGEGRETRTRRLLPLAWLAAAALMVLLLARNGGQFAHALGRALHGGWQLVALGAVLEAASIAGYVILQHRVVGAGDRRIRPKDSYDIALAGTAATRLLPTAGLGGAALTAWALKARGVRGAEIAERLLAFLLLIYAVYMAALLVFGAAVGVGLVHVASGRALGVLAAVLALVISTAAVTLLAAPHRIAGLLRGAAGKGRFAGHAERAAQELPALRSALRRTVDEIRRPRLAHLGAVAWWAFDIGVLVAMLHAFGAALPIPVVVLAYFLGTMFNVLPLPGSLSGGLAGTLVIFGAPAAPALAAVLAYRTIAVWLPAASGVASLFALRATVARWSEERATVAC
jgi:putative heme transporter